MKVTEGWQLTGTLASSPEDLDLKLKEASRTEFYLRAAPLGDAGEDLGGELDSPWTWTVADPSVLELVSSNGAHIVQVKKVGPGKTRIQVSVGEVSSSLDVEGLVTP